MRTAAIVLGSRFLGVKRSDIAKRFSFDIKTKHGGIGVVGAKPRVRMEARAVARGRPFNLVRWNAQPVAGGVRADAWGETKIYKGLGITRAPARFVFVVSKEGRAKKRIGRGAYGPGLTHALEEVDIQNEIARVGSERFDHHFVSAANYHLQRAGWRSRVR